MAELFRDIWKKKAGNWIFIQQKCWFNMIERTTKKTICWTFGFIYNVNPGLINPKRLFNWVGTICVSESFLVSFCSTPGGWAGLGKCPNYWTSRKYWGQSSTDICWLVVWNMFYFFIYWEFHHPNWLLFFRGVETTNQIWIIYIYI